MGDLVAPRVEALLDGLEERPWAQKAEALREVTAHLSGGKIDEDRERRLAEGIIAAAADDKWEVRKAAALALGELRYVEGLDGPLDALSQDSNRWVRQAAERAAKRLRSRAKEAAEWPLSAETQDPTLHHIAERIRQVGLRSLTPARIYDLAVEVGERFYTELAADTSHEMRTLVTPVEGYLIQLQRHLVVGEQIDGRAQRYVALALERLEQIKTLVDDLHTYAAPAPAQFAIVDLAGIARDAIALASEATRQGDGTFAIVHQVNVAEGLTVEAVRDRLVRAVANLIANAYQAMDHGGTLALRAKQTAARVVELMIEDTGRGMTAEQAEDAMARFATTRRDQGGTGLGLPIARRIVEHDHHGELAIESTPGQGTRVIVMLPIRQEQDGG